MKHLEQQLQEQHADEDGGAATALSEVKAHQDIANGEVTEHKLKRGGSPVHVRLLLRPC